MPPNRIRARLESLEARLGSGKPAVVYEDDLLRADPAVIEAEATLAHAEAELARTPNDPTTRSAWFDACRASDAARNRAIDRHRHRLPESAILVQYRHDDLEFKGD